MQITKENLKIARMEYLKRQIKEMKAYKTTATKLKAYLDHCEINNLYKDLERRR